MHFRICNIIRRSQCLWLVIVIVTVLHNYSNTTNKIVGHKLFENGYETHPMFKLWTEQDWSFLIVRLSDDRKTHPRHVKKQVRVLRRSQTIFICGGVGPDGGGGDGIQEQSFVVVLTLAWKSATCPGIQAAPFSALSIAGQMPQKRKSLNRMWGHWIPAHF